jgi:hypothetical protein
MRAASSDCLVFVVRFEERDFFRANGSGWVAGPGNWSGDGERTADGDGERTADWAG